MRMKRIIFSLLLILGCLACPAQDRIGKAVTEFCNSKALQGASAGVFAMKLNGDTLAKVEPFRRLVPASNIKVITCGTALHSLGASYRFKTTIAHSGSIVDGVLHGDIYIVGGGDPTTASKYDCAVPMDTLFAQWKSFLDAAGIKAVDGTIVGDGRAWGRRFPVRDWTVQDAAFYYGATPGALNFYENAQDFTVAPSDTLGNLVSVTPFFPDSPWMVFSNYARTSPAGCGDELDYSASPDAPFGTMSGYFAIDRKSKIEECVNHFPEYSCAYYFHNYLVANGLPVSNAFADISPWGLVRRDPLLFDEGEAACPRPDLMPLGQSYSPALSEIVGEALKRSDNFYAEAILRAMGNNTFGAVGVDSCLIAERRVLSQLGVSVSGYAQLRDGSGLSRTNYASPAFFVNFLKAMSRVPEAKVFMRSLPQPGQGTLAGRMAKVDASVRKRIYMKSGSMNGVRCFCGYILPADGKQENLVVFSVMINNASASQSSLCAATDALIAALAQ